MLNALATAPMRASVVDAILTDAEMWANAGWRGDARDPSESADGSLHYRMRTSIHRSGTLPVSP